jgi:hypothetical protein
VQELVPRLFTGGGDDCFEGVAGWAVVHACRHPCHRWAHRITPSLPRPLSLPSAAVGGRAAIERGRDLFLDLIDPPVPLFEPATFTAFLDFAGRAWAAGARLLVHCNRGRSRSPSLALLFLARLGVISGGSYAAAARDFAALCPDYAPGEGIRRFLAERWQELKVGEGRHRPAPRARVGGEAPG